MLKALTWYCQMTDYKLKINVFDADKNADIKFAALCPELMSPEYNRVLKEGEPDYDITVHPGVDVAVPGFEEEIRKNFGQVCELEFFQSNHEGEIVDKIQSALNNFQGILINPAAYTHTSIAILDAVKSVSIPTIEVHISKIEEREDFRQISYVRLACVKTITGHGTDGYLEAIDYLTEGK